MTVERFMTEEYNRYTKGKGGPVFVAMLAHQDLFDAFVTTLVANTREVEGPVTPTSPSVAFKSARLYRLFASGWTLVIEGPHGRQVSDYV